MLPGQRTAAMREVRHQALEGPRPARLAEADDLADLSALCFGGHVRPRAGRRRQQAGEFARLMDHGERREACLPRQGGVQPSAHSRVPRQGGEHRRGMHAP